jgi:DNA-binding NtrC family response regulator
MPEGVPIGSRPRRNRIVLAMKQERVLTLARLGGSVERAATAMGIARRTLADKMARYGLRG